LEVDVYVWLASGVLLIGCVILSLWAWRLRKENLLLKAELGELSRQLDDAIQRLAQQENEPKSKTFTTVVDLLVAAGVPGLILMCAMAVSGFSGAAAITVGLASIGSAGMLGGIGVLVTVGVVIAKFGPTDVSCAVIRKLLKIRSKLSIIQEIDSLPGIVPQKVKLKAKSLLEAD
jgi:hypothetical protein